MQKNSKGLAPKTLNFSPIQKLAPWAALALIAPCIVLLNTFLTTYVPAKHGVENGRSALSFSEISLKEALHPANNLTQSAYIYYNRDPNRLFGNFYYTLGIQLAARGQIASAETLLGKAVHLLPDDAGAHMNYGVVLEALQKNNEALNQYEQAIQQDSNLPQAYYSLGLLQDKMGKTDLAVKALQKAIALSPQNNFIHYDLGVLYAKQGNFEQSAFYSKKALEKGSEFAEAYNNYGYALAQMGQYQNSLEAIEKSLSLKPDSAATLDSKGYALYGLGRYEEALKAYTAAVKIDPTIGEIYLHLGQTYEKLQNTDKASKSYETYLQLTPEASDRIQILDKIKHMKPRTGKLG